MAVAAVASASGANVDSSLNSLVIPFTAASTQSICVFIGVRSAVYTVASVIDDHGNVYTKQGAVLANYELDFSTGHYIKNAILDQYIDCELWTTVSTGAVTKITVTTTSGAKFAVAIQSYSSVAAAFGAVATAQQVGVSTPSVTVTTTAANSFAVAGFASAYSLNQAAPGFTFRIEAAGTSTDKGASVAIADILKVAAGAQTITLNPVNTITVGGAVIDPPATYACVAIEVKA